jgi:hypothetical protein
VQAIFDGQNGGGDATAEHGLDDLSGEDAGNDVDGTEHLERSYMAVGASIALDGDSLPSVVR